jgi:hypothetical protein
LAVRIKGIVCSELVSCPTPQCFMRTDFQWAPYDFQIEIQDVILKRVQVCIKCIWRRHTELSFDEQTMKDRFYCLVVRLPDYRTEMHCFLWGMNWIYICYVEESSGRSVGIVRSRTKATELVS